MSENDLVLRFRIWGIRSPNVRKAPAGITGPAREFLGSASVTDCLNWYLTRRVGIVLKMALLGGDNLQKITRSRY